MKLTKNLPFSLFIFDLDGTVLGGHEPYKQFPPEFAMFLDDLDAHGIKWATATTWPVDEQLELIRSSGVKSNPVILTGSTGREIAAVNGDMLVRFPEYDAETAEFDRVLVMNNEELIAVTIDKIKSEKLAEKILYNACKHHVINFEAVNGKEKELWQILQPLIDEGIYYTFSPGILEKNLLLPEYMNKARAVRYIQKVANVSPCETLIAGDETNDIHMFDAELAKYMICPDNAHIEIKKIVEKNNGIIASKNYSYGIMEAVSKLLKINKK